MSDVNSNLKQAIAELEQTKVAVLPLLKDQPMLQLRTETTLNRLISGFGQFNGIAPSDTNNASELKPLKKFLGSKIEDKKDHVVRKADKSEVDFLRDRANEIISTFLDREDKEIMEAVSERELRAVAKVSGMIWVTGVKPLKITLKFINDIKEAIKNKQQLEADKANLKLAEGRVEILKNLDFTFSDETKTWTLGDYSITEEDILKSEADWDQFMDKIKEAK